MSKTIIDAKHFALCGRESLEIAVNDGKFFITISIQGELVFQKLYVCKMQMFIKLIWFGESRPTFRKWNIKWNRSWIY